VHQSKWHNESNSESLAKFKGVNDSVTFKSLKSILSLLYLVRKVLSEYVRKGVFVWVEGWVRMYGRLSVERMSMRVTEKIR